MITMAAVGVALDLITWIMPHYVVWGLHLRRAHKVAITALFAFGILSEATCAWFDDKTDRIQDDCHWRFSYYCHHRRVFWWRSDLWHRHQLALGARPDEYRYHRCLLATLASSIREGGATQTHAYPYPRYPAH